MVKKKTNEKKTAPKKEKTILEKLTAHKCPRCLAFGYHPDYCVKVSGTEIQEYVCGNCGLKLPADQVPG